jgi:hypothetical protein
MTVPNQSFALPQTGDVLDTWLMRWRPGPVRKRHVPEPERLRQLAAKLKGQADKLSREADARLAEADALEGPPAKEKPIKLRSHTLR